MPIANPCPVVDGTGGEPAESTRNYKGMVNGGLKRLTMFLTWENHKSSCMIIVSSEGVFLTCDVEVWSSILMPLVEAASVKASCPGIEY